MAPLDLRLMRAEGLRAKVGTDRRPSQYGGRPEVVAPNHLQQHFDVTAPNRVWVKTTTRFQE